MSGGYGSWQKPLIITGRIKVVEPPPPPEVEVLPINSEILDQDQPVTAIPEATNKPVDNEVVVPIEVIEAIDNPQNTVSIPNNQLVEFEEENSGNITDQGQEQAVNEIIDDENTQEVTLLTLEAANEVNENTTEEQKSE
jgi:hypothetical protein